LKTYEALGVDELIVNVNFGLSNQESLEALEWFADAVMPFFARSRPGAAPLQATGT